MKLHKLSNPKGAKHAHKRLGCGVGSGHGKTSGRGHKGAKARSGGHVRPGFEGGQMPLYRKLPHRGFNNFKFRVEYATVNVADLESLGLEEIKREDLVIAGLVRAKDALVKVLGSGELTKKVVVHADKFSASAVAKIEAAGGKAVLNNAE
ncbi:MAG: 50S ribosomal protein L15 [Verrucomicrobiaceae bacterium]|nr:50S ribosomal protein L15 [Verrucomicrobiaceae bacterium]